MDVEITVVMLVMAVIGGLVWFVVEVSHHPAASPPRRPPADTSAVNELFHIAQWEKRTAPVARIEPYERPVEVQPDAEILPPPRQVDGINGE